MIKLSHYVIGQLAAWGVRNLFLVTGGGAMHFNDSVGREPAIRYICTAANRRFDGCRKPAPASPEA